MTTKCRFNSLEIIAWLLLAFMAFQFLAFLMITRAVNLTTEYGIIYESLPEFEHVPKTPTRDHLASWYDYQLDGIWWSKDHATCASRDYPRKTKLKVTNIQNDKSVICTVNDYGPEAWTNRSIDLSSFAFSQIGDLKNGILNVTIEVHQ